MAFHALFEEMEQNTTAAADNDKRDEGDKRFKPEEHEENPGSGGGLHENREGREDHLVGHQTGFGADVADKDRAVALEMERVVGEHIPAKERVGDGYISPVDEAGL